MAEVETHAFHTPHLHVVEYAVGRRVYRPKPTRPVRGFEVGIEVWVIEGFSASGWWRLRKPGDSRWHGERYRETGRLDPNPLRALERARCPWRAEAALAMGTVGGEIIAAGAESMVVDDEIDVGVFLDLLEERGVRGREWSDDVLVAARHCLAT